MRVILLPAVEEHSLRPTATITIGLLRGIVCTSCVHQAFQCFSSWFFLALFHEGEYLDDWENVEAFLSQGGKVLFTNCERLVRFFDCGRAARCMLPLGAGRFMHLFVLYGYQGAESDLEQLALTDQLFDAALGELSVVARGQPCMLVGDFNIEPTRIPCLAEGISAGLWVDLEAAWALASGTQPTAACKRTGDSAGGHRGDFKVGCPLAAVAVSSCRVNLDRWIAPHLAVMAHSDCASWTYQVTQPVQRTPLWPASWLPAVDKSRF